MSSEAAETSSKALPGETVRLTRRSLWSSSTIVIGLAVALDALIFAIFAFLCWQAYFSALDGARQRAQTAADIGAEEIHWSFGSALTSLRFIADLGPAALDPANRPKIDAALDRLPADTVLALYDAGGTAVGATETLPATIAGEDYFAELRKGQDWILVPASADTEHMLIAQRLGVGDFAGAAVLSVPTSLLRSFWEPQQLGKDSTLALDREDGWLIGRYPPLPGPINFVKTASNWPMIAANQSGSYSTTSPVDSVSRVVAFRHIPELGAIVFAAISVDTALSQLWTSIIIVLWLIGPIALALLIFALVIARMLRQSERTQASLAAAVANNEVLFREIHHRVKNNLQSVAALLQMQPIPREIKANMGQRIAAMSAVHEHIYRSNSFSTVMVKDYLTTLIDNIRAGGDPRIAVSADIDDLAVDKDAATPLGLIVSEVVSNAFKHAFPGGRSGKIAISLTRGNDGRGCLTVADDGIGYDPQAPAKGIGQRLIRALTSQLGGDATVSSDSAGSTFTLSFPLAEDQPR